MPSASRTQGWPLRMFRSKPSAASRIYERFPCCFQATLEIRDRDYRIEGLVLELSQGGVLFREASSFILDRVGTAVTLRSAELVASGTIVNVRREGYGIRFAELMDQALVDDLVGRYGLL